ncbi:MAG: NADAR family protein [Methanobrevibacter sp.]|nr:NADAR family protein [Methanobrevibacter sp.]
MKKYSIDKPMAPLWIKFPYIPQGSIGWRMGSGEDYQMEFSYWFGKLSKKDKLKYQEMFPCPKSWKNYYNSYIEENSYLKESYYKNILFWRKNGRSKYSKDKLLATLREPIDCVLFWNPDNTPKSCLSQWTKSDFNVGVSKYNCTEQYMMAEKALFFEDHENKQKIMELDNPHEMKKLGRKVKNFNSEEWNKVKYSIVLNGNYYKFSQNQEMRNFLIATGNKVLVEASPKDRIWGVGLDEPNKDIYNMKKWKGENLLGFALMELRDELNKVYKNFDKL